VRAADLAAPKRSAVPGWDLPTTDPRRAAERQNRRHWLSALCRSTAPVDGGARRQARSKASGGSHRSGGYAAWAGWARTVTQCPHTGRQARPGRGRRGRRADARRPARPRHSVHQAQLLPRLDGTKLAGERGAQGWPPTTVPPGSLDPVGPDPVRARHRDPRAARRSPVLLEMTPRDRDVVSRVAEPEIAMPAGITRSGDTTPLATPMPAAVTRAPGRSPPRLPPAGRTTCLQDRQWSLWPAV